MALYAYKAIDANAIEVAGNIAADTARHARDQLRSRGLNVAIIKESRELTRSLASRIRRRAIANRMFEVFREWLTLLRAGFPLLQVLDTSLKQHRGHLRTSLLLLREHVASGSSLAEAMRRQPHVFNTLTINLIEIGERTGALEDVLDRLIHYHQRSRAFKGKIGNALIYPGIVLFMAGLVSILLMRFVVPNILEPLIRAGRPLPMVTQIVKSISDLLITQWWPIMLTVFLLVSAIGLFLHSDRG
ncbi:MAG: type II secretion system F family protein, partial [Planctomycetota bacterium]|nr:type II secretion system F family protein [Planctomycetota bacterium]